jgi:phage/plasmid-like protein (TIGR03299 family)
MAHGISTNEDGFENGRAIYRGTKEDVWHRLGDYTGDVAPTEEQIRKVLGIEVQKVPYRFSRPVGIDDSVEVESKEAWAIVRRDTGQELAAVGRQYGIVQYDTIVDSVKPIVEEGYAEYDTAGLLWDGKRCFMMLKVNLERTPDQAETFAVSDVKPYIMVLGSHDASSNNMVAHTHIRGVCHNTTWQALDAATGLFRIVHRKNGSQQQIEKVAEFFAHVVAHNAKVAEAYRALQSRYLTRAEFKTLVLDVAAPDPTKIVGWNPESPRADNTVDKWKEKRQRLFSLWHNGDGHTGNDSAWEAYNGVIQSLDHDTDIWKTASAENRAVSVLNGKLASIRNQVFDSLLSLTA